MSLFEQLYPIVEGQGWNDSTVLSLLLTYVENQQDNATVVDFFTKAAAEENDATEPRCDVCNIHTEEADGWCGECGNCTTHCAGYRGCPERVTCA